MPWPWKSPKRHLVGGECHYEAGQSQAGGLRALASERALGGRRAHEREERRRRTSGGGLRGYLQWQVANLHLPADS